jgi:hypothetical protein
MQHEFIFQPGQWVGEGRISFSSSPEHLHFYTKWSVLPLAGKEISCEQRVETQGSDNLVLNDFRIFDATPSAFLIELKNEHVGQVVGQGVIDAKTIAWEFRGNHLIEGFEVYELQDNGDYMVHAEYSSTDQFRTIIDGRIWKKST